MDNNQDNQHHNESSDQPRAEPDANVEPVKIQRGRPRKYPKPEPVENQEPKKRGRKPKPKPEQVEPKKKGRPPKIREPVEPVEPKKRGRPLKIKEPIEPKKPGRPLGMKNKVQKPKKKYVKIYIKKENPQKRGRKPIVPPGTYYKPLDPDYFKKYYYNKTKPKKLAAKQNNDTVIDLTDNIHPEQ